METPFEAETNAGGLLKSLLAAAGLPKVCSFTLRKSLNAFWATDFIATAMGLSALFISVTIGLLSVLYLLWGARSSSISGARKEVFPGPKRYPLVGSLFELLRNMHRTYDWLVETMAKADSSWCFLTIPGARLVVVTDPRDVEHMLQSRFENYPKGPEFHGLLYELLGNGIFNADGEMWRVQRKAASHEFSTKSLKELMLTIFNSKVNGALEPLMGRFADAGTPFNLQDFRCESWWLASIEALQAPLPWLSLFVWLYVASFKDD